MWEEFTGGKKKKELIEKHEEAKGRDFTVLAGKKRNFVLNNRKPLYYIKEPIVPKVEEDINCEENEDINTPPTPEFSNFTDQKQNEKYNDNIVDIIARKYNITSIFMIIM